MFRRRSLLDLDWLLLVGFVINGSFSNSGRTARFLADTRECMLNVELSVPETGGVGP